MISFREVCLDDAQKIMDWRLHPKVRRFMLSDFPSDLSRQREWIESCYGRPDYYHWIIQHKGIDIGLIRLNDFDIETLTTSWGIFLSDRASSGIGFFISPYLYNFVFYRLCLERLYAEVVADNKTMLYILLKNHGYCEIDQHPSQSKQSYQGKAVRLFMLTKKQWMKNKKFARYHCDFPVSKWKHAETIRSRIKSRLNNEI